MFGIFVNWEWWQIALTVVFGTVWVVCFILDCRRKLKLKKLINRRKQELKAQGYSDDMIDEIIQRRAKEFFAFAGEQCSGKSRNSFKDGEK